MLSFFFPYQLVGNIDQMSQFFWDNQEFFSQKGRHFEVYHYVGGYKLLVADEYEQLSFQYAQQTSVTYQFLEKCLHLLQSSRVLHAVENSQKYGSYLPPYLFWLTTKTTHVPNFSHTPYVPLVPEASSLSNRSSDSDNATSTAFAVLGGSSITNFFDAYVDADVCESQAITLKLKHVPSCTALLHTFLLAAGRKQERLPMHARLIFETPTGTINREQLEYVLNFFAESAHHYFKSLSTNLSARGDEADNNFIHMHVGDSRASLDLIVQQVSSAQSYAISLRDEYFDELLYRCCINDSMKKLEIGAESLVFDGDLLLLPYVGAFDVSKDALIKRDRCRLALSSRRIDHKRFCIDLHVSGNTFPHRLCSSSLQMEEVQVNKIRSCQKNTIKFLPSIEALFVENYNCTIYDLFHRRPASLHALTQKDFTKWFHNTPIKVVNVAMQSLLSRVQDDKPFTLPATSPLVSIIKDLMGYLLGKSTVDEKCIAQYVNAESLSILRQARRELLLPSSDTDADEKKQIEQCRGKVFAVYLCCEQLAFSCDCLETSLILKETFGFQIPQNLHHIAYPPQQTACLIISALRVLTFVYKFFGMCVVSVFERFEFCNELISKGILPIFLLQSEVSIPHLNKSTCLPVEIVGVTFDLRNSHDGNFYSPIEFLMHDFLFHAYFINSILDMRWKLLQSQERIELMHLIELVRTKLSKSSECYVVAKEAIKSIDLLQAFDQLFFVLMHEAFGGTRTQTRARIIPSAFPHIFLEKITCYFERNYLPNPDTLVLKHRFSDLTADMQAVLPLKRYSSFPYFVAYIMFDTILKEARNAMPNADAFEALSAECLLVAFKKQLEEEVGLLYLYVRHWDQLIKDGVLYDDCVRITSHADRLRVLAMPHIQERLHLAIIDWSLEKGKSVSEQFLEVCSIY